MPIGSSKIGVLGAGLVPGGSVTFNASGTWDVPPGVKIVSITGVGATGNPGTSGNSGNAGNPGNGGGGGGGGSSLWQSACNCNRFGPNFAQWGFGGGPAFKATPGPFSTGLNFPQTQCWTQCGVVPACYSPIYTLGGAFVFTNPPYCGNPTTPFPNNTSSPAGVNAQAGSGGSAGQAGQAGQPGQTGQSSSGLGNTFPGGAGGNAGTAGNAGSAGSGGPAGGRGGNFNARNAGSGGTGGGSGGSGNVSSPAPPAARWWGGSGGGGAGVTNDGSNGDNGGSAFPAAFPDLVRARGGNYPGTSAGFQPPQEFNSWTYPAPPTGASPNQVGGMGGGKNPTVAFFSQTGAWGTSALRIAYSQHTFNPTPATPGRDNLAQLGGNNEVFRAGGGGGTAGYAPKSSPVQQGWYGGGGGGGGGRGNAGGAGGCGGAGGTGGAGTPATFNCVPVVPGCSYPITVASPGGQIVISWNPQ